MYFNLLIISSSFLSPILYSPSYPIPYPSCSYLSPLLLSSSSFISPLFFLHFFISLTSPSLHQMSPAGRTRPAIRGVWGVWGWGGGTLWPLTHAWGPPWCLATHTTHLPGKATDDPPHGSPGYIGFGFVTQNYCFLHHCITVVLVYVATADPPLASGSCWGRFYNIHWVYGFSVTCLNVVIVFMWVIWPSWTIF